MQHVTLPNSATQPPYPVAYQKGILLQKQASAKLLYIYVEKLQANHLNMREGKICNAHAVLR